MGSASGDCANVARRRPALVAPNTYNRPHTITAELHVPNGGVEGVIFAMGSNAGGYTLFVKDGKLNFAYNYEGHKMYRIVSDAGLPNGDVTIQYGFEVTGDPDFKNGSGAPGTGILAVNGTKVGSVDMDKTTPYIFCIEGVSVGYDYGGAVDDENYTDAFPFTGTVKKVTYDVSGEAIHDAEAVARRLLGRQCRRARGIAGHWSGRSFEPTCGAGRVDRVRSNAHVWRMRC